MEFVDLGRQRDALGQSLRRRIDAVLAHGRFILGPEVMELEERLASLVGVKHCIGVANGTDALQLCLRALNVGPGDAVFVPSFTFVATAECASQIGATPVFVDVLRDTFNIDPASLERAIDKVIANTSLRPRLVIPVDLFGLAADYDSIKLIADKFEMDIIEDAAQSMGGALGSRKCCALAELATTSFFPAKPLGCYGDGGAVFTDSDDLACSVRSMRVHGKGSNKYDNERVGLNSRLDTLQAAILLSKLSVFEHEIDRRNELARTYSRELADSVSVPTVPDGCRSAWAQYTVRVPAGQRDAVRERIASEKVPTVVYYPVPLHMQPVYMTGQQVETDCSVAERLSGEVFSLPVHPYLTSSEAGRVIAAVKNAVGDS